MWKPWLLLCALPAFAVLAQQPAANPAPANVPANAASMVNPVKATPETLVKARKMYGYDCAMCHGANGNGKGDLVADMNLTLKDYTDPASLKDLSDGEMFLIIRDGKGKMAGEGNRAKPEDVWGLVLLLRSFSRK